MYKVRGVQDLADAKRFQWKHIAKEMIDNNVPGNWHRPQNVYNLLKGRVIPKDAYVYVIFSRMFDLELSIILSRYTSVNGFSGVKKSSPIEEKESIFSEMDDEEDLY